VSARQRVAALISGRGSNMAALIEAARAADYPAEIALVLSNRPGAGGLATAAAAGVATAVVDHRAHSDRESFERAMQAELTRAAIDVVCLAGFMRLLSPWFVQCWEGRMLNIHPALLPAFKGLHTHERALEAGVKIHGCTVHLVTPGMDEGPILAQAALAVTPGEDAATLGRRVLALEHRLYPATLKRFLAPQTAGAAAGDPIFAGV
jgi:phosphoribosylglycinamide formyltransferase-1